MVLPGRKSVFRAGFRPDYHRENIKIGPPDWNPAEIWPGRPMSAPDALWHNLGLVTVRLVTSAATTMGILTSMHFAVRPTD